MAKSTFKSLAATTAITLATVGTPALAEETTQTVEATNDAVVSTTEAPKAEAPKTSADVKPALDTQTQVVSDVKGQVDTAQNAATQAAVDTAQSEKDAADADVTAKDASVKSAQAAIDGTGVAQAQANLTQAQADVKTATTVVDTATKAVDTAKKADADRDAKIKVAETDVKTKSDAVTTASNRVTAAQGKVSTTTDTLTKANDAVTKAQDALKNIDTVTIADLTQFKDDVASGDSELKTDSGATAIENSVTNIGEDEKSKIVNVNNLTEEQILNLAQSNLQIINAIRKQYGLSEIPLTTGSMSEVKNQIAKYVARNKNV
ncbi:TPA: hypothetical protein U1248_001913 [Streptococcus suis]|nr:hypothetical protein [Streptococcus suis]HEM5111606.1 hypothetical protein [Streptococcus suis]